MKPFVLFFVFCSISFSLIGQGNNVNTKNPYDVNFSTITQQEPFFPAGDTSLYSYFRNCIHYSNEAKAMNIDQTIMVSFDVMPDSTIANTFMLSGAGYGVDEEALKCLSSLKYAPGIQNATKIKMNVILTIPVNAKQ